MLVEVRVLRVHRARGEEGLRARRREGQARGAHAAPLARHGGVRSARIGEGSDDPLTILRDAEDPKFKLVCFRTYVLEHAHLGVRKSDEKAPLP